MVQGEEEDTSGGDDLGLEPVGRDRKFLVRLVLCCLVGVIAAGFVGLKLRTAAGSCGASLVRPGGTVIEPMNHGG